MVATPASRGQIEADPQADFKQIRWDVSFPLGSFEVEFRD